jgi:hypothetical protein
LIDRQRNWIHDCGGHTRLPWPLAGTHC